MSNISYSNSLEYERICPEASIALYMPKDITQYHKSREMAMQVQERYSNAGISKETLTALTETALELINNENSRDKLRTNMSVLWNNVAARMKYPVDELCAIRMGAIACFMEGEPLEYNTDIYTNKKVELALKEPVLYAFFLHTGIAFTPGYVQALRGLGAEEYLANRAETLAGLTL